MGIQEILKATSDGFGKATRNDNIVHFGDPLRHVDDQASGGRIVMHI